MADARKLSAEDRLHQLLAVNHGFAGGKSAARQVKRLARLAGYKD